jgi:thymidylate synthase
VCGVRKLFPKTAAAEVAWFLMGSCDVSWLRQYAPIWDKFVEADGFTIAGAYGHRWRVAFGRDQIGSAIEALQRNPSDRRIFISAWDPAVDGLGASGQKNVPCPVGFTLSITNGRLNSTLLLRSSDVFVGLPYDVMGHALLMRAIARSINPDLELGRMHVSLAHPHIYETHWQMARTCVLGGVIVDERPELPASWSIEEIAANPEGYVTDVAQLAKAVSWPSYSPRPEVVA